MDTPKNIPIAAMYMTMLLFPLLTHALGQPSSTSTKQHGQEMEGKTSSDSQERKKSDFFLLDHCHRTILYYYYYDNKNDYIPVKTSIDLQLDRVIESGKYMQVKCYATIEAATPGHRLMLRFNNININSKFQPYLHERLHIFDGTTRKDLTPLLGLHGNFSNDRASPVERHLADYVSLGSTLIMYFEGIPTYSSFEAIVTSFQDPLSNGTCPEGYILCQKSQFCIPESLRCDGVNNCGSLDQSDEEQCFYDGTEDTKYSTALDAENIGLMVGSSVSLLILMIVIIWFSIICIKRAIMKRDLRRLLHSMAPPNAPDTNRIHIPPHAAMAMLSPPPLYSEGRDPEAPLPTMELPPPYWSEMFSGGDTDRLITSDGTTGSGDLVARVHNQNEGQGNDSGRGENVDNERVPLSPSSRCDHRQQRGRIGEERSENVRFVGNVANGLPPYTSSDDLPSYAAATENAQAREDADNLRNEVVGRVETVDESDKNEEDGMPLAVQISSERVGSTSGHSHDDHKNGSTVEESGNSVC